MPEAIADPFGELLKRLGEAHETRYLETLGAYVNLSGVPDSYADFQERRNATQSAVRTGEDILYQPVMFGWRDVDGEQDFIMGIPDLLVREGDGYLVRDCKLARHVSDRTHPEIARQLELYGWLLEQEYGEEPLRLEVLLGDGEILELPYDGGRKALAELDRIKALSRISEAPYEPVGWSKCAGCPFKLSCWDRADQRQDVAVLFGVDQKVARQLHADGNGSYADMLQGSNIEGLMQLNGVGETKARKILRHAEARYTGKVLQIGRFPHLLDRPYVMFDIEGVPEQPEEWEKAYLWGLQVFGGSQEGWYRGAVAPFRDDGDWRCWEGFLDEARDIFEEHGDIPFVHYASYEKRMINRYVERYGDPAGVAGRVLDNLLDLYTLVPKTVILPDPSYSLKLVEKRAGYQRSQAEYGGEWSIAKYIAAVETGDATAYEEAIGEVLIYNREDLEATWAVFQWMARDFSQPLG